MRSAPSRSICLCTSEDAIGIYAYDAYLIRCALKYESPLISLGQKLVNSAKEMRVKVIEVVI